MSMTPITQNVQGQSLTFMFASADLSSLFPSFYSSNSAIVAVSTGSTYWAGESNHELTPDIFVGLINGRPPAEISDCPVTKIRAVLATALVGGGMTPESAAVDTAERILRNQNSRDVDFLAAQIVAAAIAAG
jgi:hypothetical protein